MTTNQIRLSAYLGIALLLTTYGRAFSAGPVISNMTVTNLRDVSFTVSWITDMASTGTLNFGTDSGLGETANDDRGATFTGTTHYVTLSGFTPNTTYFFDLVSGSTVNNNGGAHYIVTTSSTLDIPEPDTVYGRVFKSDGITPAHGAIVYLNLSDNNGSDSPGWSAPASALADAAGYWFNNLGNVRVADSSAYFSYSASGGDTLRVFAHGGMDGNASPVFIDTANDKSVIDLYLTPPTVYGVALAPTTSAKFGNPGAMVSHTLTMTNTGNTIDTFILSRAGNVWTTVAPTTLGPLAPGANSSVVISVTIPSNASAGASDSVAITVASQNDGTKSASATLTTTANTVRNLVMSPTASTQFGNPGTQIGYTFHVTNTGNAADNFSVSVSGNNWATTAPATTGALGVGISTTIRVSVTIPIGVAAGTQDNASVTVTSQGDATKHVTAILSTKVNTVRGIAITPLSSSKTGNPGNLITHTLQITNTGNATDSFTVGITGNAWTTTAPFQINSLSPGVSSKIVVSVTIPSNATGGASDSTTVTVSSQGNAAHSASSILTTTANTVRGLVLTPASINQSGIAGTTVTYTLRLTNTGNVSDSFWLAASGNNWTTTLPASVGPLAPGVGINFSVSVFIPANSVTANDVATLTATSFGALAQASSILTTTKVSLLRGVTLTPTSSNKSNSPGRTVTHVIQLTNTGSATDSFTITVSSNMWNVSAPGTINALAAGNSVSITINVNIPANAAIGTSDTAVITATSQGDPTQVASATLKTTAQARLFLPLILR
ncbi:MAG: hypothetical protein HZB51_18425 [Chloroflexi bacterium]|nr:hypothetical protein [Chloroflexota bacterium]